MNRGQPRQRLGAGAGAAGAQQRNQPKSTQGTVDRVPCPHCGRPNDFRELDTQQLLDTGHRVICRGENAGEGCGQLMEVVAVRVFKMLAVKPIRGTVTNSGGAPAAEASTMSPQQLQRLLKGRP